MNNNVECLTSVQAPFPEAKEKLILQPCLVQFDPFKNSNIYEFNKKPIQPIIKFPKNKSNRKFIPDWYKIYTWLEYSISQDKAFCHVCRLFSPNNREQTYTKDGFNDWKHARERFDDHEKTEAHKAASISLNSRIQQDTNQTSINVELENFRKVQVKKNREYMSKIIESIKWLSEQSLALRGHNRIRKKCQFFIYFD